jgi:2-polyprenyl-3-methyl-5-hydroxy-6-metoxy-1,4-benzoquinol methylase
VRLNKKTMKKNRNIINIIGNYEKSRIILTACELDIFSKIHSTSKTAEELADRNNWNLFAIKQLLNCLVALDLLKKERRQYSIKGEGFLLSSHSAENFLPLVRVMNQSWNKWHYLTDIVKLGYNPHIKESDTPFESINKDFIDLMHLLGEQLSVEIAELYELSSFSNMMDVGGASGTYTISFLKKNPKMNATIFDLADVLPLAEERLKSEGLLDRVHLASGDFNKDSLPKGYDLVLLSDILGQNSNEENIALLNKIYQSLNPNGVLLIRDYIMDDSKTHPLGGALFSMLMLVESHGIGAYSFPEIKEIFKKTKFTEPRLCKRGAAKNSLIEARKVI